MTATGLSGKAAFLQQLSDVCKEKLSKSEARQVCEFADGYFRYYPADELLGQRFSDVYGGLLSAWQLMKVRKPDACHVEVFNPDLESDGWQSTHTLVQVVHGNMPFLIDSLRIAINQRELAIHSVRHAIFQVSRDAAGKIKHCISTETTPGAAAEKAAYVQEALILLEIDRHSDQQQLAALQSVLSQVLQDVRVTVADFPLMKGKAVEILQALEKPPAHFSKKDISEAKAFIQWLINDHFTFLGYDEYDFVLAGSDASGKPARRASGDAPDILVQQVANSELGILRASNERPAKVRLSDLSRKTRDEMMRNDEIFIFAKSAQRSQIHRPAYPDYIAVKKFDKQGRVIGERRFLGLYTARVYNERPDEIPFLRRKVQSVIAGTGVVRDDYAGKALEQILTVYPRDELFQIDSLELQQVAMEILYIEERRKIKLFLREDVYGQFVTCLVFVPRDLYSTELRLKIERLLVATFAAEGIEFTTYFSESVLARTHFTLRVAQAEHRDLPAQSLQEKVIGLAQSWQDGLADALYETHGEEVGSVLAQRFRNAFPASYREFFSPRRAAVDIDHLQRVGDSGHLAMSFYRALEEDERTLHFKLFFPDEPLPLSDVLPIFENLGFRVIGEHPFETLDRAGRRVWIYDFTLQAYGDQLVDIHRVRGIFEDLFDRVWSGSAENDGFNRLVLAGYFDWRQIAVLRSYARYMRQIRVSNSQTFIASTLVCHVRIAQLLLELFETRLNPQTWQSEAQCNAAQQRLELEITAALEGVDNLSEDKILRLYVDLIKATLRTNYYQLQPDGDYKPYLSFKLNPAQIPDVPLPLPKYEIFVYSPRVEGVHLRGGKVARGGLRWSDRFEDYRTEILGLVKAQQVKNAVIVPVGAKGGFVAKQLPTDGDRDAWQKEGIAAYQIFVRGLLDLTDNLVDGVLAPPANVLRHDDDDTYLVVAADKGTATFSDIANQLAAEYGFWLGDAFASGGSNGYDHKKMGITARGAWVSVQRHFQELNINIQESDFTVVGIGDMAGDVFGNGMLMSRRIRLVAAFNHQHIFIDPQPDPQASYQERQRLFNLPRSGWNDYNPALISQGGGVFNRSAKSIPVSAQMKSLLGIKADRVPPNMLISHLLKAPVDLLWVGGIGTFVKAASETHADAGDKANDGLRVDARDLRCKLIGEGGNLGVTQRARIEYALNGGRLNTDFIDNAGGVDCSDHEVNLKILLNPMVAAGDITLKNRNSLLESMTDQVAGLVLRNNYRQTLAISIASAEAVTRLEEYRRLISSLEDEGKLNRALEFLPDDEAISARKHAGLGLTRPELSVLISYVKGDLKQQLGASEVPDDPSLAGEIHSAFPEALIKKYGKALKHHHLRREIIATQLANDLVNHMGITFIGRMRQSTGADVPAIALAWIIAREVFRMQDWWRRIEALDNQVPHELQVRLMSELMRLVRRATGWLLRNRRSELNVKANQTCFTDAIAHIATHMDEHLTGQVKATWQARHQSLMDNQVPEDLAAFIAGADYLYSALGMIEAQEETAAPLQRVAHLYYSVGEKLQLDWFSKAINSLRPSSHWQALARETFREDLDWQQRAITIGVLRQAGEEEVPEVCLARWAEQHASLLGRWHAMLTELRSVADAEYAMFSVALRELLDLAQSSRHVAL